MKKDEIIIDDDFKIKVVNFLKIYGGYQGILVRDKNDKKYVAGEISIDDIINNKNDFKELKVSVNVVLDCCYENGYRAIERIMKKFYSEECSLIKKKYGSFFDKL